MNAVILEDEPRAAIELQKTLETLTNPIYVVSKLQSVAEAINWFSINSTPDLIVSDIQLLDGLSFDVFEHLRLEVPVIFCTAYNEYALTAFANNGIDYILKPFEPEQLAKSIQKLYRIGDQFQRPKATDYQQIKALRSQLTTSYQQALTVSGRCGILPIPVDKICYLYLQDDIVYLHTKEEVYELRQPLDSIAKGLNPRDFYRANRQFLIHRNSVASIKPLWTRKLSINLWPCFSEKVIISKAKSADFMRWIRGTTS